MQSRRRRLPALEHAAEAFDLKSVSVDLPESDVMFPGPGRGRNQQQLPDLPLGGHGAEAAPLSKATWDAEVHKMINAYKAPIAEEDVAPIVEYLTTS